MSSNSSTAKNQKQQQKDSPGGFFSNPLVEFCSSVAGLREKRLEPAAIFLA
jgi:hypothetical protein